MCTLAMPHPGEELPDVPTLSIKLLLLTHVHYGYHFHTSTRFKPAMICDRATQVTTEE